MKRSMMKSMLALAALAITLCGMQTARAQYEVTGTTAGGGNIVVGYGFLGTTFSGDGFLTNNGSDHLTITLGSFATANNNNFGGVINFFTNNDTFVNYGTITASGSETEDEAVQGAGVSFEGFDSGTLANETVINHGNIFAGEAEDEPLVGSGLSFAADDAIQNISITNTGIIEGSSDNDNAFIIGSAVMLESGSINGVALFNSGNLLGGSDTNDAEELGNAVIFASENGISNVSITNTQGANILGGNGNFSEGEGEDLDSSAGNAIFMFDDNDEGGSINGVTISNAGTITGGNLNEEAGEVGNGIAILGLGPVTNISITNSSTGVIQGGNDNDDAYYLAGTGIGIVSAGGEDFDSQTVSNVSIANYGLIQGGHDNNEATEVGAGIGIDANSNISNINILNGRGGSIMGGDDNDDAGAAGDAIDVNAFDDNVTGVTISNFGNIRGGNNNDEADFAGNGIAIDGDTVSNIKIFNAWGATIAGGNDNEIDSEGFDFTDAGTGIYVVGDEINGLTITNWGVIRGGNDEFFDEGEGGFPFGGDAIDIQAGDLSNVKIFNGFTGIIQGGLGGGYGIDIYGFEDPANVEILNYGLIAGGQGAASSNVEGGSGIVFNAPVADTNINIKNYGYILGGNGAGGGNGGAGILITGNNTAIQNWGVISGGANSTGGAIANADDLIVGVLGSFLNLGDAIFVDSNNNTLNLNGHSAVYGKIAFEGSDNTVNLNFTGLTPAQVASLDSQLASQGVNSGTQTPEVVFTVRGVTYDIDPAIVNGHLTSYQTQAGTGNQGATGAALDSATTNPVPGSPLFKLFNAIDTSNNVPGALQELSPQDFQIYGDIALANANFMTLEIDHRLNNLRDGSESVDTTGIGGDTTALTSGMSKDDDGKDGKEVITPMSKQNQWGFFASGNAIFTNIDAQGGQPASGFTSEGMMMGVDGRINEHWVVGTFFNYEHTDADLDSQGSTANVDSYSGGLYTGYHNEAWYGNGLLAYTRNNYDSNRNIDLPGLNEVANGSTSGNQYEVNLDGGYDFHPCSHITWGPIGGMQYVHMDVDGFNESGAPAEDLAVGSQNMDSLRTNLGFQISYNKQIARRMEFATQLHVAWQHEFLDDSRGIGASFIGDGLTPFTIQTTSPERDAALVGVGANLTVRDKYTFFFDYDVQAGQESYLEQSVKGGLKISW